MRRDLAFFTIKMLPEGGKGQSLDLTDTVTVFAVEEDLKKAAKLQLNVINWDLSHFDNPVWRKGNILEVQWGYPGNVSLPEQFVIRSVTGGSTMLMIVAHSKGVLMNLKPGLRVFDNTTRSEVATKIAREYGYGEELIQVEDTKVRLRHVSQGPLTDAQFLKKLALKEGFEFYVDASGFHFHRRNLAQKPVKELTYYTSETGDLIDFDIENDITALPGKVTAKGIDPLNKKKLSESADKSTSRDGLGSVLEVIDPVTGKTSLQSRVASEETVHTTESDSTSAGRQANAKFRDAQALTVKLAGQAVGDPQIRKGRIVKISGIGKRLSGNYYIKETTHRIDQGGYTVDFSARRDGTSGYGDNKDVKSGAAVNTQTPGTGVQVFEEINGTTGATTIKWRPAAVEQPPSK